MYIRVLEFNYLPEILKLFYSLFSCEAKEFYSVQFGQLGRKLQSLEILISVERTLALKDARSERVHGI